MSNPNPHDPQNLFCIYCQKQFKMYSRFRKHILTKHGEGLARKLGLIK